MDQSQQHLISVNILTSLEGHGGAFGTLEWTKDSVTSLGRTGSSPKQTLGIYLFYAY